MLTAHQASDRALVASFHGDVVAAFRAACPKVATSATDSEVTWFYIYQWLGIEALYRPAAHALQVPPSARGVTLAEAPLFAAARARGMHVDVWTVNDRETMRRLFADGVAGVITDRPDLALDVLGRSRAY